MSATTNAFVPAEPLFRPGTKEKSISAARQQSTNEPRSAYNPERRFWKLSAQAVSPKSERVELFILLLCLILALAVTVGCFLEMSHLLNADPLEHVAKKALGGGA
jgi:hypothetical protein